MWLLSSVIIKSSTWKPPLRLWPAEKAGPSPLITIQRKSKLFLSELISDWSLFIISNDNEFLVFGESIVIFLMPFSSTELQRYRTCRLWQEDMVLPVLPNILYELQTHCDSFKVQILTNQWKNNILFV